MKFKAKLRKIGNSVGVIIPLNVITSYTIGDIIDLNVITNSPELEEKPINVITPIKKQVKSDIFCPKHKGYKLSCGCP